MNRAALEHIIRAASAITNEREFVVIGSQSVLGQHPAAPADLLVSMEADIYPRYAPEKSDLIDGTIGELSRFHEEFGYYAHGVDDTTAVLPRGWEERLHRLETPNTAGGIGWCLEVHDLAASKLVAGRERDLEFVRVLLETGMVDRESLAERLASMPLPESRIDASRQRLSRLAVRS